MATIYAVLKAKLGREPTHRELCEDVKRILAEGACEKGKASSPKEAIICPALCDPSRPYAIPDSATQRTLLELAVRQQEQPE